MDKQLLRQTIIATLDADLAVVFGAARAAHAAATHEECVADNKYDTLGLEASYLAQGQANRAQEIRQALDAYRALELRAFDDRTPIRLTALVTLEDENGATRTVFLGPDAGGLRLVAAGEEVVVITPRSPLGRALLGKCCGDTVVHAADSNGRETTIVAVS